MKNEQLDKEILDHLTGLNGRLMAGRCGVDYLRKKGYLDYLMQRYSDNSSKKEYPIAEILHRLKRGIEIAPVCPVCGAPIDFDREKMYKTWCSRKCANNDPTIKEKNSKSVSKVLTELYSDPDKKAVIQERKRQTYKDKYGWDVYTPFAVASVQEKAKQTILSHYGVDNVFKIPGYRFTDNVNHPKQQAKVLWLSRGFDVDFEGDDVIIHNGCPIHGDIVLPHIHWNNRMKPERRQNHMICPICHPIGLHSGFEIEAMAYLDTLDVEYLKNNRTIIKPYELDFAFPDKNVAIEVNGVYYHNTDHKPQGYHKTKQDCAINAGYDLLQLWEHDFANRRLQCINYIDDFLGLNSPVPVNIKISVVDNDTAEYFKECCTVGRWYEFPMTYDFCIGIVNETEDDLYGIAYIKKDGLFADNTIVGIVADIGIDWTSVFDVFDREFTDVDVAMLLNYEHLRTQHVLSKGYKIMDCFPGIKYFDNNGLFDEVEKDKVNEGCFEIETSGYVLLKK